MLIPIISQTSIMGISLPWYSTIRVLRVFLCWRLRSAQMQFSGKYPRLLSFLSMDIPFGLGPISEKKFSKLDFHLSQTVIPLAP